MTRQVGIRLLPNEIDRFLEIPVFREKFYDFIQVLPAPGIAIEKIERLKEIDTEFVVNIPYYDHGVDLSVDKPENEGGLYIARKSADILKAKYIILHAGKDGTVGALEANLGMYGCDKRYIVENTVNGQVLATAEEIRGFCDKWGIESCFDFGHAIARRNKSGQGFPNGYLICCNDFLDVLNPKVIHFYDTYTTSEVEGHLHFGEGNLDIPAMLEIMPKDIPVLLEVPALTNYEKLKRDVELVRKS